MEEQFTYPKLKSRYYTLGKLDQSVREVWIVCHGYGYLARYFLKKFEALQSESVCIIAPEGLSRFYIEGFSGRVGATWMTKENRLVEIENYVAYLNEIYKTIPDPQKTRINVLGFSQGSSTVSRWALHQDLKIDNLILWAGEFPPDIDKKMAKQRLSKLNTYMVYGKSDPFLNKERIQTIYSRITNLGCKPQVMEFEGDHDIPTKPLLELHQAISDSQG